MEVHRVNTMGQKGTKLSPNAVATDEIHSRRGNSSYTDIHVNYCHFNSKVRYSPYLHQAEFASLPSMESLKYSCTLPSQDDFLKQLPLQLFHSVSNQSPSLSFSPSFHSPTESANVPTASYSINRFRACNYSHSHSHYPSRFAPSQSRYSHN